MYLVKKNYFINLYYIFLFFDRIESIGKGDRFGICER